jgi:hypothetical protein
MSKYNLNFIILGKLFSNKTFEQNKSQKREECINIWMFSILYGATLSHWRSACQVEGFLKIQKVKHLKDSKSNLFFKVF